MILAIEANINESFLYGVFALVLLCLIVAVLFAINFLNHNGKKSFKDAFESVKPNHEIIIIDYDTNTVSRYFPYSQKKSKETISIESFIMRFDKINADKLRIWFDHISRQTSSIKRNRIEIVMYNEKNEKRAYLLEALRYQSDPKRYYIDFLDITDSIQTKRRILLKNVSQSTDDFLQLINNKRNNLEDSSLMFVSVIKFKEFNNAVNELSHDNISLLDDTIFQKVKNNISENDSLCKFTDGALILFSYGIGSVKKYRKYLRGIIQSCSGSLELIKNKYSYMVSLVGGYKQLDLNEQITNKDILECESACNFIMNKGMFSDRIQPFDEMVEKEHQLVNNKLLIIDKVISMKLYDVKYVPIVDTINKEVEYYYIKTVVPHSLNMGYTSFVELVRQRNYVSLYYENIFEKVLNSEYKDKNLVISFDHHDLKYALEAYESKEEYSNIKLIIFLEFPNRILSKEESNRIVNIISESKKERNIEFGININSHNSFYLNDDLFSLTGYLMLSYQMVSYALDSYMNQLLLEVYSQEAKNYNQKVLAIDVNSLATYEAMNHYSINYLGGTIFNNVIENERITDRLFLNSLKEIEEKKY